MAGGVNSTQVTAALALLEATAPKGITANDQVQLAPHSTSALSPPVHTTESPPFKLP